MEKDIIPPGDSVALEIIFFTKQYRGLIVKAPKIYTNEDSTRNVHFVSIATDVVTDEDFNYPLAFTPHKLILMKFGDYQNDSLAFSIKNLTEERYETSVVAYPEGFLEVGIPTVIRPEQACEATVKILPEAVDLGFYKSITFQIDDTDATRFTIPVSRTIIPD